jgi:SWI/SNF-related matrix-associated actin-dependent regulator of chromatin subfamily A containing DEAD/H box 1
MILTDTIMLCSQGTPVQNSPKELMSLLCFLMPLFSRRGSKLDDDDSNQDGGEGMLQHFVSLEKGATDDHTAYAKLKQLFSPFVLRRRKKDVLSQVLPPKVRKVEFVPMSATARRIYDAVIAHHVQNKLNDTARSENIFTQLRKAAHHPLLLRSRYTSESEKKHMTESFYKFGFFKGEGTIACESKDKIYHELAKYNDFEIHLSALQMMEENALREVELSRYVLAEDDLFGAEKCVKLRSMLPGLIAGGHRILLFSVWTSILDILSCLMESMDINCRRMDGSSPVSERQSMIDEFNGDPTIKVFLLSTRACGLGINLTSADTCIVYDMDFNPFADLQAEDRCHR